MSESRATVLRVVQEATSVLSTFVDRFRSNSALKNLHTMPCCDYCGCPQMVSRRSKPSIAKVVHEIVLRNLHASGRIYLKLCVRLWTKCC
jgi:hypothetical protein